MTRHPSIVRLLALLACALVPAAAGAATCELTATGWLRPLGAYPLCEASAAITVGCSADPTQVCVWVADNEDEEKLFEFSVAADGELQETAKKTIPLGPEEISDVEALALDGDDVIVVGSHSRKGSCDRTKKRLRIARVSRAGGSTTVTSIVESDDEERWGDRLRVCDETFVRAEGAAAKVARLVCGAIQRAELAHPSGGPACGVDAFNVEGAVMLPGDGGKNRLWLGLRAPLVGDPDVNPKAILLRVAPLDRLSGKLSFDGVALLDLRGTGIREITVDGEWLWGIAGSVADGNEPSRVFRLPVAAVESGKTITDVQFLNQTVPSSAEGLVIQSCARRAIVVVDGNTDDESEPKRCNPSAQQLVLPLQ